MAKAQSIYDAIASATPTGGGNYFTPNDVGAYKFRVRSLEAKNGYKGTSVILTVEVAKTIKGKMEIGDTRSCAWNVTGEGVKGEMARSNVKAFLAAALDVDHDALDGAQIQEAIENGSALEGHELSGDVYCKESKAGHMLSLVNWSA